MADFLPLLRRNNISSLRDTNSGKNESVLFQILFEQLPQGRIAYVQVINSKGTPIQVDYRLYQGETFNVLRAIDGIRQEQMMRISWSTADERICLSEFPFLLFTLLRSKNLVDKDLKPITVSDSTAKPTLQIIHQPQDKNGNEELLPAVMIRTESGTKDIDGFLSDVFLVSERTIYPIKSIGENYNKVSFFESSFPDKWIERYLSVFYSYFDNVDLEYEDYTLRRSNHDYATIPTVIFEKVDEDMALYLRAIQTLPGVDFEFLQQFDIVNVATLSSFSTDESDGNREVVLHHINQTANSSLTSELYKAIVKYAPSKQAQKNVYQNDDLFIIPQETAGPFLLGELPHLVKRYQLIGAERLKDYKVTPARPRMKVNISSGIDFLEGSASIFLGEEEFSLRKFLQQYNKQKYILLSNGNRAIIDDSYVRRLERLFHQADKKKETFKVSFFDLPEIEDLLQERMEGEAFENHRQVYEGFNKLKDQQIKLPKVKAKLRDYQKEGVKWINYLYEQKLGGCLADDMGLGKTLQTITMLASIYQTKAKVKKVGASLIVMPKSLLFNWQNELKKFAPQLTFYTYYATQRDIEEAKKSQLILTTYAMVRNDAELLCQQKFHYVILDESQNIKNTTSQTTKAIWLLKADHRLALSGTPIENNLTELYALFRFLNPAMFNSLEEFNRQYTYPIQKDNDKDVMEALRRKIYPFILRRLKRDVLQELPDRTDQTLIVEMTPEQARFYEERRRYYYEVVNQQIKDEGIKKSQFVMFQALSELRRIASVPESLSDGHISSPKLEQLIESLTEAVQNGHKVVVFFNFIAGIELVSERLDQANIDFTTMTGSTHDRRSVIERFQNDPRCRVMLMTLKTGGVGLNLTMADTVYIFEPWWNKAAEEQAINRLHRIGQKANVLSFSLITKDTIEEKIRLLQEQKAELFEGLIGSDQSSTKVLSEEDIRFILS